MANKQKTRAGNLVAFADNTTGNISAQDGRNLILSAYDYLFAGDPTIDADVVNTGLFPASDGFDIGTRWLNTISGRVFESIDSTVGAAEWEPIAYLSDIPPATVVTAGTGISVLFDGDHTYEVSSTGGGGAAPLTLQPPTDPDFGLALKQHSPTQSGPLLKTLDSSGTQFGPRISAQGELSNPKGIATTGNDNEMFGAGLNAAIGVGNDNVLVGSEAGLSTGGGSSNVYIGRQAGKLFGGGNGNTAVGNLALFGGSGGSYNVAIGDQAAGSQPASNYNTAVGRGAGTNAPGKSGLTSVGFGALSGNATGDNSVGVGYMAGASHPGTACTFIGENADTDGGDYANSTAIGSGATVTASNQIVMGTAAETVAFPGTTSGIQYSDLGGAPAPGPSSSTGEGTATSGASYVTLFDITSTKGIVGALGIYLGPVGSDSVNLRVTTEDFYGNSSVDSGTSLVTSVLYTFQAIRGSGGFPSSCLAPFKRLKVEYKISSGFPITFNYNWVFLNP